MPKPEEIANLDELLGVVRAARALLRADDLAVANRAEKEALRGALVTLDRKNP